jgi:hypothetical protein
MTTTEAIKVMKEVLSKHGNWWIDLPEDSSMRTQLQAASIVTEAAQALQDQRGVPA